MFKQEKNTLKINFKEAREEASSYKHPQELGSTRCKAQGEKEFHWEELTSCTIKVVKLGRRQA